jgi:thiamine-phosphate pyrophosphorylase
MRRLLAITDRRIMGPDPIAAAIALIERLGPRVIVQVREKDLSARALLEWVQALLPKAKQRGASLMVNDRADLALSFAPELGLHLPENGIPIVEARAALGARARIGASIHDPTRAKEAFETGADLVVLAPIFATPGKGPPIGTSAIEQAVRGTAGLGEVFALGGIDPGNAPDCWAAGAGGIAAIRAAWSTVPEALLDEP